MSTAARRAVRWAFYLLIVAAFGYFVSRIDWEQARSLPVEPAWILGATALGVAFRYLGVVVWRLVLRRLGATSLPPFWRLADVYAKAWLARYIPGTIPWIAGKIFLAAEQGISKARLAVSSVVEAAAQVVGVGIVSLGLLALDGRLGEVSVVWRALVAAAAVLLLVALVPAVFNRLLRWGFALLRRKAPPEVGWALIGSSVGVYACGSLVAGASYVLFTRAFVPGLGMGDVAYLVGAFGLAGVVGMLTPLVPSGLGTRDGAQLLLLLVLFDPSTAAFLVVVSRIWSALVDVLFWAAARAWAAVAARRAPSAP